MKKQLLFWSMLVSIFTIGNATDIVFPDANFKAVLLAHTNPVVDTDGNGEISEAEAEAVTGLDVSRQEIRDLSGIEYFINLTHLNSNTNELSSLDVSKNTSLTYLNCDTNELSSLDVSKNTSLITLYCGNNELSSLDVSKNTSLTYLNCYSNELSSLDVTKNTSLVSLYCGTNELSSLDVSKNTSLTYLNCDTNELSSLDVSKNTSLTYLNCDTNELSSLDVSKNTSLVSLYCGTNELSSLDVSKNTSLTYLDCSYNELTTLDVRSCTLKDIDFRNNLNLTNVFMTGQPLEYQIITGEQFLKVGLSSCPNLQFICADQEYLNDIYLLLEGAGQTSCLLSNDCDAPNNLIQGNLTYDTDSDGCGDEDDVPFVHEIPINIFSATGFITAFPNEEGRYIVSVTDGEYKFIPDLASYENYFNVVNQPVFNFLELGTSVPSDIGNLITDFCIQPNGDFNDLEVNILPISGAVPGFEATYQILYANNGTTTQSGTITLDYQDDVLAYASSTPSVTSDNNGQLTWDFQDLSPMESIKIPVSFTLNTPTDSPALNGGDILNFTATVTGATDETPDDNVMELVQTVVNSYDPNDKTCLEGDILDPDDVGGYLHYLIRFENEGTAEARNIRVTDVIDTTKFDIETLRPLESSHSYSTTITNGNEVEFAFYDINLPFDDANNDGYVFFEIKTLDTLVEGDTIVNSAAIYFDYNFPIITEDSVVKVEREESCDVIDFIDVNFKNALVNYTNFVIDTNGDGEICIAEAEAVTELNIANENISDLTGIRYFTSLIKLYANNNQLTSVDISNNVGLTHLKLNYNELTTIDISNNTNLFYLVLENNNLTAVDVYNNVNLSYLYLTNNSLTAIDVSKNDNLSYLFLRLNDLTSIDVSNNISLKRISVGYNDLTSIDFSENINLTYLYLVGNSITTIDLANQSKLDLLNISYNELSVLDVSSSVLTTLDFSNNPNLETVFMADQPIAYKTADSGEEVLELYLENCPVLEFICADQEYLVTINDLLKFYNQLDTEVSSDCTTSQVANFSDYFTLSPNPTTGIINLDVLDDSISISYIVLYDLNGIFRGYFIGSVRTMDLTDFYARTYVMQILTDKGEFSTQFIKL